MHGGSMDRNSSSVGANVGKLIAAHEFCLWLPVIEIHIMGWKNSCALVTQLGAAGAAL